MIYLCVGLGPMGRIVLVGTGPGDPTLVTLKALDAVRNCDCVYGFEWAARTMEHHGVKCELLRADAYREQLRHAAGTCSELCVLLTDDPTVSERDIVSFLMSLGEVEFVPGVSSLLAAFNILKMPFDKVLVVSFNRADASAEDMEHVAWGIWRGLTVVVLPGPGQYMPREVARRLIAMGVDKGAPVNVLEKIYRGLRMWSGELGELAKLDFSDMSILVFPGRDAAWAHA